MHIERRLPIAEVALVAIAAIWGLTFPLVQDAVRTIPVMTFLAYRFIPAAALVGVLFRREVSKLSRRGVVAGIVMGIFLTGGYVFQTFGLDLTSSSNAGFITGLFVVLTPVFGALLLKQRAGTTAWAAAGVSALGLFLLSGVGGTGGDITGDALVFVCACFFAFHILATGRAVTSHDVGALLVVQLAVAGVFTFTVAAASAGLVVPLRSSVWIALLVTALLATALGFFVQTYAQRHASPARTALILASEPAFAGFFSYLLKGETLSAAGWVGAGLILASIVTVETLPYLRPPRVPLPEQ